MSESKSTRFQFKFAGVEIEIHGKPPFVNKMYRTILADVEKARKLENLDLTDPDPTNDESLSKKIIWIHKCTQMMNKIYMTTLSDLQPQPVLKALDLGGVGVIYCDRESLSDVLPEHQEGQTLWAELTSLGKIEIANSQDSEK